MGRDLSSQKNVMASIHSLLKRLVESNEIETKDRKTGNGSKNQKV
jgi:hypothetical protein